jgi:xanthine/uracil permease
MDIRQAQANIDALQAATTRLVAEIQKTERAQRWLTPLVTVSGLLAVGMGMAAVGTEFVELFLR